MGWDHRARALLLLGLLTACGPGDDATTTDGSDATGESDATTSNPSSSTTTGGSDTGTSAGTDDSAGTDTGTAPVDLYDALAEIPGMDVEELEPPTPGVRLFALTYQQPVDHDDLDGAWFGQRLTLYHRDAGGPMVLATTGYGLPNPKSLQEPTLLLAGANQLTVEQRFFGPSRPEPPDWSKLTIYQAATDHHRIVEALRPLYPGSWASTGASKGGMTSVYHRRFYPGDVDATVAYVAPHNLAALDDRYTPFVDGLGASACAQALRDVQADALTRRAALVDLLAKYADNEGVSFDRLGLDRVVEFSVLESRFVFWQYGGADGCVGVPTAQASDAEVFAFLDGVAPWRGFGDELLDYYGPYYYQAATQLGAPEVDEDHLGELRLYPGEDVPALYAPEGAPIVFDDDAMPDIASWLNGAREPVMFVYGGGDPWTAAAFDPGGATEAPVYFVADGNHGSKLTDLAMDDFDEALALLRSWTGVADAAPAELLRSRARAAEAPAFRHARP